jgi:hypothetical protein
MSEPNWRVIGDHDTNKAYIPIGSERQRAIFETAMRWRRGEWTPEERAEMDRLRAVAEAKRQAQWLANLTRHVELLKHTDNLTVLTLLQAHSPVADEASPAGYECRGCAVQIYDDGYEGYPTWPCPTWELIEREEA